MINEWKMSDIETAVKKNKNGGREVKYAAVSGAVKDDSKKIGEVKPWVMSMEVRDRDGEVMKLSGARIDNYNNNPVVCWMHHTRKSFWHESDYNPDNVIGKGKAYFEGDQLVNDIEFEPRAINELAWKIESKIEFGSLRMGSIGFIPLEGHWGKMEDGEDTGTYYMDDWELTEFSIVVIPSNPMAGRKPKQHEQETVSYDTDTDKKQIGATALTTDVARARLFITTNSFTNE